VRPCLQIFTEDPPVLIIPVLYLCYGLFIWIDCFHAHSLGCTGSRQSRLYGKNPIPPTFFFFAVLEFDLRGYTLSQSTSPIFVKGFQDRVSRTICPGWLQTAIFLLSARVIGVSHQCPNKNPFPLDHVLPLASKSYPSLGRQLESGSPQPV
jgi:hypothetical protein